MTKLMDTLIEIALIPLIPLAYVVWLLWRRHEHKALSVRCDGGGQA